jgi:polar amino acid transport system permease protein
MDFGAVWDYRIVLAMGFVVTLELSAMAIVCSTIFGFMTGLVLTSKSKGLKAPFKVYVEIFRGSPLLIQLFMIFFGLPYLGIEISLFQTTILVFTLYGGAYIAEIFRSGIESVPKGQFEAAASMGLTYAQTMKTIILPQAMKVSLPPLMGFHIGLIKDTSIASVIGYMEVVKEGKAIINITSKPFDVYIVISLLFFAICYPLSLFVTAMEKRTRSS